MVGYVLYAKHVQKYSIWYQCFESGMFLLSRLVSVRSDGFYSFTCWTGGIHFLSYRIVLWIKKKRIQGKVERLCPCRRASIILYKYHGIIFLG